MDYWISCVKKIYSLIDMQIYLASNLTLTRQTGDKYGFAHYPNLRADRN
jgi:hypothetical protein